MSAAASAWSNTGIVWNRIRQMSPLIRCPKYSPPRFHDMSEIVWNDVKITSPIGICKITSPRYQGRLLYHLPASLSFAKKSESLFQQRRTNLQSVKIRIPLCDLSNMPSGETVRTGLLLILAVMWEGRNEDAKTMRLPKAMALRFISDYGIGRGKNPVTVLCESLGCTLIMPGSNKGGNVTNIWNYPIGTTGTTEITVQLKPSLIGRWNRRGAIMKERQEKAEPATATIRATLKRVTESARFKEVAQNLTAKGEIQAVASWRKNPGKLTRTIDGDLLTGVNRLTKELRQSLLIGGREVIEIDLKSAHVAILPMLLVGDNSAAWIAETARFQAEYSTGFKRFYGERKEWKHDFLATFNQSVNAARHSCPQYREFERSFPILAKRMNWIRAERPKALGTRLRSTLAKVMIPEIKADVLLITDGLLLPKTADVAGIIARLEQAISQVSGIKPIIETESA